MRSKNEGKEKIASGRQIEAQNESGTHAKTVSIKRRNFPATKNKARGTAAIRCTRTTPPSSLMHIAEASSLLGRRCVERHETGNDELGAASCNTTAQPAS